MASRSENIPLSAKLGRLRDEAKRKAMRLTLKRDKLNYEIAKLEGKVEYIEHMPEFLAAIAESNNPNRIRAWAGLRHAIRETLKEKPEGITLHDVEEFTMRCYPNRPVPLRRKVSLSLSRMRQSGELCVLRPPSGAMAAVYGLGEDIETGVDKILGVSERVLVL